MDQRTHAWIAIRAFQLLSDEGQVTGLADLLRPFVNQAAVGSWIPDKRDAKIGGGQTQNHVFKIGPYSGPQKTRFTTSRDQFLKQLGPDRKLTGFINDHNDILDDTWWKLAYKADPPPGKHLANRAMALTINNLDMLMLGDAAVQKLVPGRIEFADQLPDAIRTPPGQAALFCFMLSHFIADAMMPCHCDDRDLSDYDKGLHKELEKHWSSKLGPFFDEGRLKKDGLKSEEICQKTMSVDGTFQLKFSGQVPAPIADDIWQEIVYICRGSFALASVIAPPALYPYKNQVQQLAPFEELFPKTERGSALLAEIDMVILHDAVLNVAMIWKYIWKKFH